jgi:copper(I)-binding protein
MKFLKSLMISILFVAISDCVFADAAASVQVSRATIFVPLGKAKTTDGLLTLKNIGKEDLSLIKITSPYAKQVVLNFSSKDPVLTKRAWTLAANQTLNLELGKQFLTFDKIKYQISTGDEVELSLWFSDGRKLVIMAKVKSAYDLKHSE